MSDARRMLIIAGSDRRVFACPGVDSKARALMLRLRDRSPREWTIDTVDLGNFSGRAKIQSCNACVSTSMALCVWPCNCYRKNDLRDPDLMWDLDLYARLELADVWAIIGPVNWYGPSSNLKLMFDRLVCMNGGNPDEKLIAHKDPELAMALERSPAWEQLSLNHLEGRTAAFFCYGDGGGDELDAGGRPKILLHKEWFDPDREPFSEMRETYAPLVWQCRYGGIEVPDSLWRYHEFGRGQKYSENQAEHIGARTFAAFDQWSDQLIAFAREKPRANRPTYSAVGHRAPSRLIADWKLKLRAWKIALGRSPPGSSPSRQKELGLSRVHDQRLPQDFDGQRRPWTVAVLGALLFAQGIGKALDVPGYLLALSKFDFARASWMPRIGEAWMTLELATGLLLFVLTFSRLTSVMSRVFARVAAVSATAIAIAYLSITTSAYLRGLSIDNCTCFGVYLTQRLSLFILAQDIYVLMFTLMQARTLRRALTSTRGLRVANTPAVRGRAS